MHNEVVLEKPDPILNLIEKYKNHPSILAIKNYKEQKNYSLCFQYTAKEKASKHIRYLDKNK